MIQTNNLTKTYTKSGQTIHAVDNATFTIDKTDFVVLYGPSGSGKSSLLLMLGGMLQPASGTVLFNQKDIYGLSRFARNRFRRRHVGFIFQKFFLMPYLTAYDNIRLQLTVQGYNGDLKERITQVTQQLDIASRMNHYPAELSVGEQQRVAMARTLAGNPDFILADEPTGNLDRENSVVIARCLQSEHESGKTIVLVTHDESLLELGTTSLHIVAGRIVDSGKSDEHTD